MLAPDGDFPNDWGFTATASPAHVDSADNDFTFLTDQCFVERERAAAVGEDVPLRAHRPAVDDRKNVADDVDGGRRALRRLCSQPAAGRERAQ